MPMTDRETQFDHFLAGALAPPDREPDPTFVERVRQRILLDELMRANRARVFERLGVELLSLVALACGLAVIGTSSDIADFARQVPHLALFAVITVFALWVALIVARPERRGLA